MYLKRVKYHLKTFFNQVSYFQQLVTSPLRGPLEIYYQLSVHGFVHYPLLLFFYAWKTKYFYFNTCLSIFQITTGSNQNQTVAVNWANSAFKYKGRKALHC